MESHVANWDDDDEVTEYLTKILNREAFDGKGLIYGIGHAVYTESDPRCHPEEIAQALSEEKGLTREFDLYNRVEGIAIKLMQQHRQLFKPICANVDFYSGFVYSMLGLPMELFTPIFAISRISGWCAHRIEELANEGKIIRPCLQICGPPQKTTWQSKTDGGKPQLLFSFFVNCLIAYSRRMASCFASKTS